MTCMLLLCSGCKKEVKLKDGKVYKGIEKKKQGEDMKAITIKQPWASLIANGYKIYEFRYLVDDTVFSITSCDNIVDGKCDLILPYQ